MVAPPTRFASEGAIRGKGSGVRGAADPGVLNEVRCASSLLPSTSLRFVQDFKLVKQIPLRGKKGCSGCSAKEDCTLMSTVG